MQTDHELLAQYFQRGPEADAAFGTLVTRHTDMVYATCLRILRDPHQAEDAAQAAFLVLVRRGKSIGRGEGIGGWLYRVAVNAARNTQRVAARRERHEQRAAEAEKATVSTHADLEAVDVTALNAELDAALNALPRAQRDAIVARCLQGRTQAEAAAELGCPAETVHTRVNRGLEKLRLLLTRRDVRLSAAALLLLLQQSAQHTAPAPLSSSIQAACLGKTAASLTATAVAMEVANKMLWIKLTTFATCAAVVLAGFFLLREPTATQIPAAPAVAAPPAPAPAPAPVAKPVAELAAPPVSTREVLKKAEAPSALAEAQRLGASIDSGLAWLAKVQEADGHFDCKKFGGAADQDVAVTSIAALSLLGAGHTEKLGIHKGAVKAAVQWLAAQPQPADITQAALRVIVLAENCGMSNSDKTAAQAAVDDLVARQNPFGDWQDENGKGKYARQVGPTTWALIALKSAKVSQLKFPREVLEAAIKTFDVQQREVLVNEDNLEGAKMAAALALQRQFSGEVKTNANLQELVRILPKQRPAFPADGVGHEIVLWWQGSLALFQQGGEGWSDWSRALKDALIPAQVKDGDLAGSWDFRQGSDPFLWGRIGSTGLAALPLEVEMRYIYLTTPQNNTVNTMKLELEDAARKQKTESTKDSGF